MVEETKMGMLRIEERTQGLEDLRIANPRAYSAFMSHYQWSPGFVEFDVSDSDRPTMVRKVDYSQVILRSAWAHGHDRWVVV